MTTKEFEEQVSTGVTLVDFWAPWCNPCKAMDPIVEKIKAKVLKVNADESSDLCQKYMVMALPTFMVFRDGVALDSVAGKQTKEKLESMIEKRSKNLN